jgi:hypothetical protein
VDQNVFEKSHLASAGLKNPFALEEAIISGLRPHPRPVDPRLTDDMWAMVEGLWDPDPQVRPSLASALSIFPQQPSEGKVSDTVPITAPTVRRLLEQAVQLDFASALTHATIDNLLKPLVRWDPQDVDDDLADEWIEWLNAVSTEQTVFLRRTRLRMSAGNGPSGS